MSASNLNGKWSGTIVYGDDYGEQSGKELYFDMELIQEKNRFKGSSTDIGGIGMSEDSSDINGTIRDNVISFVKRYIRYHHFANDGTVNYKSEPGPKIYYIGEYDETTNSIKGIWQYRIPIKFLTIITYKNIVFGGTWNMKRK